MILARRHPDIWLARFMCNARSMANLDLPTPVVPHIAMIDLRGTTIDVNNRNIDGQARASITTCTVALEQVTITCK